MTRDAKFWDKVSRKYAASPVRDEAMYAHTLERTRNYLNANDKALEIGCGTGSTALKLGPSVGAYLATDLSQQMIEIAQEKLRGTPIDGLSFAVADDQLSDMQDDQYDVALAFSLLHLVPDLEGALKRAFRVLKPGGLMISKTACLQTFWIARLAIPVMQLIGKAPFVAVLSQKDLEDAHRAAGFEIEVSEVHNTRPPCPFIVARKPG